MLDRMRDRLQKLIVEKELQTLTHARAGDTQRALLRFQESCVLGESVKELHAKHSSASEQAAHLLAVFREEERKVNKMLSPGADWGDRGSAGSRRRASFRSRNEEAHICAGNAR